MPKKSSPRGPRAAANTAPHYDPVLSLLEAADYLGYHWQTVRKEIKLRNLAAVRRPGAKSSYRIRLSELNRWLRERETKRSTVQL